tara:strand:- start:148 stop:1203 length:1056 start_codon:yes stop_codon:yes gene_type:complete
MTLFFLELSLILFDNRGKEIWRREIHLDIVHKEKDEVFGKFIESGYFDKVLGWNDSQVKPAPQKKYIAQSYGDSFTLSLSGESWQKQFFNRRGEGIINLGSQGYGLDQACLKFEKVSSIYNDQYKTKYTILGLYCGMYRRLLNYYAPNYFVTMKEARFMFKPIYINSKDTFKLILPPCVDKYCLIDGLKDKNSEVYNKIIKYDYWYNHEMSKPKLKFPRLLSYFIGLPDAINKKMQRAYNFPYSFMNDHSIVLTKYLISNFCNISYNQNNIPLILLMYSKYELGGIMENKREDKWLLNYLNENKIRYVDTSQEFLKYINDGGNIDDLFGNDGVHYNIKGDSLISISLDQKI